MTTPKIYDNLILISTIHCVCLFPIYPPTRVYAYGSSKGGSLEKRAHCGMGNTGGGYDRSVIIKVKLITLGCGIFRLRRLNRRDLRALGKRFNLSRLCIYGVVDLA